MSSRKRVHSDSSSSSSDSSSSDSDSSTSSDSSSDSDSDSSSTLRQPRSKKPRILAAAPAIAATQPHPSPPNPHTAAAAAYLKANEITISDSTAPPPCLDLRSAPFPQALVRLLCAQGFTSPSPVQAATWPVAALGRDVLAIAKTGSGKTLGFLLPVLARCLRQKGNGKAGSPQALIMAPTRELALQIHAEAAKFGGAAGCRAVAIYGGAKKGPQVTRLRQGCELIVGTPGRIKDVLDCKHGGVDAVCDTGRMRMLVLDEADRMLDMGFERDIRAIVWQAFGGHAPRKRQTFCYSATWPLDVQAIAADMLAPDRVKVVVGKGGMRLTASTNVAQHVHVIDARYRMRKFQELMRPFCRGGAEFQKQCRVIVFANRKDTVKTLEGWCRAQGMACERLSGDRKQNQREATIRRFKDGSITVVVATDVASRGLDIKGVQRVINYELPKDNFHDYVHRIGRTGRAGAHGRADSFFTDGDKANSRALIKIMTDAKQAVPPELAKYAPKKIRFD